MRKRMICLVSLLLCLLAASSALALDLTVMTLFASNSEGQVDDRGRWNTGPKDTCWDLFVYRGEIFDPAAQQADAIEWLSDKGNLYENRV